ncbi:MAG: hypothetical protein E8D45_10770 [Nitrospira sp.]|nr:MAG: hypothetical protein E8D45_10770 [Nitrospira sp.]
MTKTFIALIVVLIVAVGGTTQPAFAVEFAVVGARAAAMGGTGVATTSDAFAAYWNPAGLAMSKGVDIRVQGTGQLIDRLGVKDTLDEINSIGTSFGSAGAAAAAKTRLDAQLAKLSQAGSSVSAIGSAGLYFKTNIGDHAIGFSVSDVATGGLFAPSPLSSTQTDTTLTINGQLAAQGLEARQAALSYAYAFEDRTFALGATVKLIQGAAYNASVAVQGTDGDTGFTSDIGKAKISTKLGIDVGAIYRPAAWLRAGVVAKDINQPAFNAPNGERFKLTPQVRGGLAINPWETMTLSVDGDITSNKTLVPGQKSRVIGVGAEQTFFSQFISLRAGAMKNTEDPSSKVMPTGGLGLRLWVLRMDLGGGYDFQERQAMASGTVALTF